MHHRCSGQTDPVIVVPQLAFSGGATEADHRPVLLPLVRELASRGAREVSMLDLDGAVGEDGALPAWLTQVLRDSPVPLRLDLRLHDGRRMDLLSRLPVPTVVLDQSAVFDAMLLRWALDLFGRRACFEVQMDDAYVFDAPEHAFGTELVEVVGALHLRGMRRMLLRDVTGSELPLTRILEVADRLPGTTIAYQGPVHSVEDIAALAAVGPALEAVLIDAELVLERGLDLDEANRAARPTPD